MQQNRSDWANHGIHFYVDLSFILILYNSIILQDIVTLILCYIGDWVDGEIGSKLGIVSSSFRLIDIYIWGMETVIGNQTRELHRHILVFGFVPFPLSKK